jgi:uncharacterized membrane protein YdjX (TVP38/TMEM64 family)
LVVKQAEGKKVQEEWATRRDLVILGTPFLGALPCYRLAAKDALRSDFRHDQGSGFSSFAACGEDNIGERTVAAFLREVEDRGTMTRTCVPQPSRGVTAAANRYAPLIKGCSVALIVVSLVLMLRRLPVGPVIENLQGWIASLGVWGALVFALLYVAASLLLMPASALTLAAGAVFGLALGTLVVSLASTTAAGLAFLIARYFARQRIARQIRHYPRFDAIDRAIREGGWKIVALLRLSPAVPFTLQNYLYGLTGIRFWPYLLTSWLAMLPGTFLYIYLGHLGRAGVEAASGERSRTPAEWVMLGVGLLATVTVTVYITRLARQALRQRAGSVAEAPAESAAAQGWPWGATVFAAVALALLAAAVFVSLWPKPLATKEESKRTCFVGRICNPSKKRDGLQIRPTKDLLGDC